MTTRARGAGESRGPAVLSSRQELDTVLRRIGDGVTVQDCEGRLVYANDAAARLLGFPTSDELLDTPVPEVLARFELLDEERRPFPFDRLPGRLVIRDGKAEPVTVCYRIRASGEERWSIVNATAIFGDDGRPTHAVNVFHDVTAVKRDDERARFMAEATTVLNRSLDLRETLAELGNLLVPAFADRCVLDVVGPDGAVEERVSVHADPGREEILRELQRRFGRPGAGHPAAVALREQRPVLLERVTEDDLRAFSPDPEEVALLRSLGLRSGLAVPLAARDRRLGVLFLGTDVSGRPLREGDLLFARELANRVAAAVDNALLYEASRESEKRLAFLAEAGELLASSLDYESTLASVARLVVPELADWSAVDVVAEDGRIERLVVAHADPGKVRLAEELAQRYPPDPDAPTGTPQVIRTGRAELVPEITGELLEAATAGRPELLDIVRELGFVSTMIVPLPGRGRTLGAIALATSAESGRRFGEADLRMAEELARRAATAIENARLFGFVEQRADAARALQFIGDGVLLVDADDVVRVWNPAAERITGIGRDEIVGRPVDDVFREWPAAVAATSQAGRPATVPLEWDGEERWLSVSRAEFPDGAVFAFRDVTEDRRIERLKDDFVATVSHELRTPVATVYGAARTLAREDVTLAAETRDELFELIRQGTDRLAGIVEDVLAAGQLEAGAMEVSIQSCDPGPLVERVLESARVSLPEGIALENDVPPGTPSVAVDPQKLEQVLGNLVENAVKYSPDGGLVAVRARGVEDRIHFSVEDEGLGIPPAERERVFDKFYRLDPQLTRGVGGTGLGLYVCRELVERMGGRIWIEGREGRGVVMRFELPRS